MRNEKRTRMVVKSLFLFFVVDELHYIDEEKW